MKIARTNLGQGKLHVGGESELALKGQQDSYVQKKVKEQLYTEDSVYLLVQLRVQSFNYYVFIHQFIHQTFTDCLLKEVLGIMCTKGTKMKMLLISSVLNVKFL